MQIHFNPVGIIHTPFTSRVEMPVQPSGAEGIKGTIELNKEFQEGLSTFKIFPTFSLSIISICPKDLNYG